MERKTSEKVEASGGPGLKKVSKIEKKESVVIVSKNSSTLKKVSSRQDIVVVKKDSRVEDSVSVSEEPHHANQDRKVSKVVTKNNDAIVKSDDDDNEDDIDNDSMEDDVENLSVFNANKTRKSSEPPPVMKSVEIVNKDSSEIHSQRKQSFLNPFEPPCPELVNKSKLIEEFNTVQEQNLKNNIKHLEEPLMKESITNIEPSNKTYFTSQALNNATSSTINQALKLDIEFPDDKIGPVGSAGSVVAEEMDSLSSSSEGDLRASRRQKMELDYRVREQQEDDLDDLVSQVQMLETSKMKLEVEVQQMKKENRRELQGKEDELEDARAAAAKKLKSLEQQLEQEHEERMGFVREKHELESKIMNLQDMLERSGDEDLVLKLKRDLKRTKALLKDAHLFMEKNQTDGTNKVIMRQLKNQLEDAEFARSSAIKSKQNSELELTDVQTQLEDIIRNKNEVDDKNLRLTREKADLQSALSENEEELCEVMRKYKACVATVSTDQITIQDQSLTIQTLEQERNKLREQYAELCQKLDHLEGENVSTIQHKRLELKIREMESKLELEKTTKTRMETMIQRMKEVVEKMTREMDDLRMRELSGQDEVKKMSRQLRDVREEMATVQSRELELSHKKSDLEKQLEVSEAETLTVKNELKIALRRIEDLQNAIGGEMDSEAGSDQDSDSSDEDMSSFIDNHRRSMSIQRERESLLRRRDRPFECISEED